MPKMASISTYTVSGPYGITKKGSGSLWLNGQNTYTGVTTVEAGHLYAGDGAAHTASFVSPVVNNSNFTVDAGLFGTTVLPGLSGTGSFTKKGRGTLAFAGAEIAGGSFLIARHQWQEPNAGNIDCTVPGGTTLNFTSQTWEDHFTFLGTENLDMGTSPVTLKVYQGNNPRVVTVLKNMLTVGGSISGSMGLTKAGRGAMTLTAANAFTGTTSVNGGVLRLAGAGTSGTGAISIGADGALELDNSSVNADRLGDAAAISVGGRLTLKAGRDIKSLPLAVNRLLSDVMERLKAIKPEILIEFRQSYIGPAIRKYGNIFRAADCPADILTNRVRTVDLRLFSGNTAVHSDMLEWNMNETAGKG